MAETVTRVEVRSWLRLLQAAMRWGAAGAAEALLREGRFADAGVAAERLLATDRSSVAAHRVCGAVALWRNDLPVAIRSLSQAARARLPHRATAALLGEALYRDDRFLEAAPYLSRAG